MAKVATSSGPGRLQKRQEARHARGGEESGMNGYGGGEVQMTVYGWSEAGEAGWDVAARGRCYQSEMSE